MRPDHTRRATTKQGLFTNLGTLALWLLSYLLVTAGCPENSSTTPVAFAPASGPIGTMVTITGTDLSTTQSVTIGGVAAIPLSQSSSALTALVMPGATSGPVQVTTATGVVTPAGIFTVSAAGVPATQQGAKLVGTGAMDADGIVFQGASVALSADGTTALVGGYGDNSNAGAAWVYTRTAGVWTQQGAKLVGTGAVGTPPQQGFSVSLSADGQTAVVGGWLDNFNIGAAWVFTP